MTKNKKNSKEQEQFDCRGNCEECKYIDNCKPQVLRKEALENPDVLPFQGEDIRNIADYFDRIDELQEKVCADEAEDIMEDFKEKFPDFYELLEEYSCMDLHLRLAYKNSMNMLGLIDDKEESDIEDEDDEFTEDL